MRSLLSYINLRTTAKDTYIFTISKIYFYIFILKNNTHRINQLIGGDFLFYVECFSFIWCAIQAIELTIFYRYNIPIKFPVIYVLIIIFNIFLETNFFRDLKYYNISWDSIYNIFIPTCPSSLIYLVLILLKTLINLTL